MTVATETGTPASVAEERISYAERAYREIRRLILNSEMPAGTHVLEKELSVLLEMSRTPIHEAMIRLAEEGMVEIKPRHGMRVLPVSADDMQEIYQILTALESEAAEEIAREGVADEAMKAMRQAVDDMDAALKSDDLLAWAQSDDHFHRLLMENCPNRRLRALVSQFLAQSHRVRMLTLRLRPKPVGSNEDHEALLDAIERRDADAARQIHREHRFRNGRMLVGLLRDYGLTQL